MFDGHTVIRRAGIGQGIERAERPCAVSIIRVNATCRKCPHKVHRMEMKTAISFFIQQKTTYEI